MLKSGGIAGHVGKFSMNSFWTKCSFKIWTYLFSHLYWAWS